MSLKSLGSSVLLISCKWERSTLWELKMNFTKKKRTSIPKLAKPIPKAMVIGIGLKAISIMPPYTHNTVSPKARHSITRYVVAKKAMDTISQSSLGFKLGRKFNFVPCHWKCCNYNQNKKAPARVLIPISCYGSFQFPEWHSCTFGILWVPEDLHPNNYLLYSGN